MFEEFVKQVSLEGLEIENLSPQSWGNNVVFNNKHVKETDADIAIIGVKESRESRVNEGSRSAPDEIRKYLYALMRNPNALRIIDLGNIEPGFTVNDTSVALTQMIKELKKQNIIAVIIGGSQYLTYAQFKGHKDAKDMINIVNIDNKIDLYDNDDKKDLSSDSYLLKILTELPNNLFNYTHLAYQTHFVATETLNSLEKLHFDHYRLGKLRENIAYAEPLLRNAYMVSFDIGAIRSSDAPGNEAATPNGLTGEDACQLARYAGASQQIGSFGIYEVNPDFDNRGQTAHIAAQMIWYFTDGYYSRTLENVNKENGDYVKYTVSPKNQLYKLVFWKSKKTDLWWMEIPYKPEGKKKQQTYLLPCSYLDYQQATLDDLPERWLKAYHKLT
jgi:formiminoglutamase